MVTSNLIVQEIRLKVARLFGQKQELEKKLDEARIDIGRLQKEIADQKNTITILEEKNKMVKLAESLSVSADVQVLKKKLDVHIREIDECIRLLSEK